MHIAIDASRAFVSQRTGTENYSYQLIKAIAKIDRKNRYTLYTRFSNVIATSGFAGLLAMTSGNYANFTIKNIPLTRLWTQLGLAWEVFWHKPDVLFVPAHTMPIAHRWDLKTVVTIHDLGYEYLPQYHQFPHKLYLNKTTEFAASHSTHLIAVSEATKRDLIKKLGCPEEKITVIYEGFDKEKFKPVRNKSPKLLKSLRLLKIVKPYILFVGTLQPRKNIERLIEAFAKLCHDDKVELMIAGNKGWMYEKILAAPKKFGIENRVKFLGFTQEDDLPALYSGALAFCLPSLFEGFGLPVLEAMACGCPVVVSKNSSLPEVAGDAGLYVDPYDVDDMAKNLRSIIENRKLRDDMRKKGLVQAEKFSWKKAGRETIEVLMKVGSF